MTQPTVAVTGTAEREVAPDSYALIARIEVVAASSTAAYERLAARAAELDAALRDLPVEIDRQGVGSWQDRRQWRANRTVRVTGREFDRLADVAEAVGRVADVAVDGPEWSVDRDNPAHAQLQAEAVHVARARAERYAAALDGALGGLVELSDTDHHGGYRVAMAASAKREMAGDAGLGSLDLEPRAVPLSASVQARWYLVLPPT